MTGLLVTRLLPRIGPRTPGRHYEGLPPDLATGTDERVALPHAAILAIEKNSRGQIFLYRFTAEGDPVGDTWHQTVEDAIEQAETEYGDLLGSWVEVPTGRDALEFALHERGCNQKSEG